MNSDIPTPRTILFTAIYDQEKRAFRITGVEREARQDGSGGDYKNTEGSLRISIE